MDTCLLIKMPDKRKFLIHEKNMPSIIEYVKTFRAEIYQVEVIEGKIINHLKCLAEAICNQDYKPDVKFNTIKKIYPKRNNNIKEYIQNELCNGKIVSLKNLKEKYKSHNITDACLCAHFSEARKQLINSGVNIKKIGQGKYCLEK